MIAWQKYRRWLGRRRERRSGWAYHHHAYQIIVSKEELAIQLWTQESHENLIHCLALGRAGPEYERRQRTQGGAAPRQ